MSASTRYQYKDDGILPDGSKIPDIPLINLLFVRRDRRRALTASAIVDTGFDASIYSNIELAELLEGLHPTTTRSLETPGHKIECEVFTIEGHISDEKHEPRIKLGDVEIYVPTDPADLTPDILIGRQILNRMTINLNGIYLQVQSPQQNKP